MQMQQQQMMQAEAAKPLFVDPNAPPEAPAAPSERGPAINKVAPTNQVSNPMKRSLEMMK